MTDDLWIGNNHDVEYESLEGMEAVLNVANDMYIHRVREGITYAQCGLIDGPGNPLAAYHAAVLMLYTLIRNGPTLVVDHDGTTRPVVVAIMYLHLTRRMGWDHWLGIIGEKCGKDCVLDTAHRSAFNRTNWRLLSTVVEGV